MTLAPDSVPVAPDYGREIPPRLNPDVPDMINRVSECFPRLRSWISDFRQEITELAGADKLDPGESAGLQEPYRQLQQAVAAGTAAVIGCKTTGSEIAKKVHLIADHAKYVYAIGARDIAALQYHIAELAGTGRLDRKKHYELQWGHCLPMWETLYHGTLCAVRDERTWDGMWDWSDNTYSDGRQVMTQVRVSNWETVERQWPYHESMCGEGAVNEHPLGSVCQIAPVIDPHVTDGTHLKSHEPIVIDLDELITRVGPRQPPTTGRHS